MMKMVNKIRKIKKLDDPFIKPVKTSPAQIRKRKQVAIRLARAHLDSLVFDSLLAIVRRCRHKFIDCVGECFTTGTSSVGKHKRKMDKSRSFPSSPRLKTRLESFEDFVFLGSDEELDFEPEPVPAKSPIKAAVGNIMANAVITALTNAASKENLLATTLAKTVLTGAANTLSATVGGVPGVAVGALIAGGIYAYNNIRNRSALDIIRSLSPQQQKQLMIRLARGLKGLGIRDLAEDIINRNEVRNLALTILSNFLSDKFNVKLVKT